MQIKKLSVQIIGMLVHAQIGVPAKERVYPQPLRINVTCVLENLTPIDENLSSTYDYSPAREKIIELTKNKRFHLLESLAETIAKMIMVDTRITSVTISITKPFRFPDTEAVGITATFVNDKGGVS